MELTQRCVASDAMGKITAEVKYDGLSFEAVG
jgi:hypothetical protein